MFERLRKRGNNFITTKDWNTLLESLEDFIKKIAGGPGIKISKGPLGVRISSPIAKDTVIYRAKTQEAAQADAYISVKLLDSGGTEYGSAFDATCLFTDGATAANTCLPDVQTAKTILISKIDNTWYIVNPTFIKYSEC